MSNFDPIKPSDVLRKVANTGVDANAMINDIQERFGDLLPDEVEGYIVVWKERGSDGIVVELGGSLAVKRLMVEALADVVEAALDGMDDDEGEQ